MISVGGSVVALHPLAAAAVSDGHHQRQQIDAAGQTTPHDVLVTGVLARGSTTIGGTFMHSS